MKNSLLFFCFIFLLNFSAFAQDSGYIDPRLYDYYEPSHLEELSTNTPHELHYLNWYLDNSYVIREVELNKCEGLPYLHYLDIESKSPGDIVTNIEEEDFNILLYHTERSYDRAVTYRIGDSGKILILLSYKTLTTNYNKHAGYGN